jgi:hypothetical protein
MSKKIQITDHGCSKVFLMREEIQILTVEKDDGDGLIATFSDGTTAGYVAEELLELRPNRERTEVGHEKVDDGKKAAQKISQKKTVWSNEIYEGLKKSGCESRVSGNGHEPSQPLTAWPLTGHTRNVKSPTPPEIDSREV